MKPKGTSVWFQSSIMKSIASGQAGRFKAPLPEAAVKNAGADNMNGVAEIQRSPRHLKLAVF